MIGTIFKKELKETLRDRRTIIMMIVIPTLVLPVILTVIGKITSSFEEDAAKKEVVIGVVESGNSPLIREFHALPGTLGKRKFVSVKTESELKKLITSDSINIGLVVSAASDKSISERKPLQFRVLYHGTEIGMEERAKAYVDFLSKKLTQERYQQMKLNEAELTPLSPEYVNVASDKEMIGKLAGGFLPYIFIAFGFMGCMYPAIDLFTGEKERGTIETLLTAPVPRLQILIGKMGVVVCSGLLASTCSLAGLFLSIEVFDLVKDKAFLDIIHGLLTPGFLGMLYLLLLPLVIFFAGIMVPIAIRSKSFKEAQSAITPMNMLIILPAMAGLLPGIELNAVTAVIPIVNVVLATKELIAGTLEWPLIGLSFVVMCTLAFVMVSIARRKFGDESSVVNG